MLVNVGTGACFRLNRVGADLWTHLAAGTTVGAAVDALEARYDIAGDVLEADAFRLCTELLAASLILPAASSEDGQH